MTLTQITPPIQRTLVAKNMIIGAVIALALITLFLAGIKNPDASWGKYWMLQPLLIVPCAGAMGGLFYYLMGELRKVGGWISFLSYMISFFGYLVAVWLGTVLGLNGTFWN